MRKKLSIVVPIYNVEKYLDRCIDSLVNQSYSNIEIILVDDGSPDECGKICDNWAMKDSRIIVIHKKNGGLSDARNCGIKTAKGEYVAFVDSDDFVEIDMYSKMIDALERTESQIATCGRYVFYNDTLKKKGEHISKKELVFSREEAISELLKGNIIEEAAWDKVYLKRLFEGIEFPLGEINEDIPIMPKVFEKTKKIVCVGEPLYYYCYNPSSITKSVYSEKKLVVAKHIEDVSKYVLDNFPGLETSVRIFRGRYSMSQLYPFYIDKELKIKYRSYFEYYRKNLINNSYLLLRSRCLSFKKKIDLLLMVFEAYEIKNLIKRVYAKFFI